MKHVAVLWESKLLWACSLLMRYWASFPKLRAPEWCDYVRLHRCIFRFSRNRRPVQVSKRGFPPEVGNLSGKQTHPRVAAFQSISESAQSPPTPPRLAGGTLRSGPKFSRLFRRCPRPNARRPGLYALWRPFPALQGMFVKNTRSLPVKNDRFPSENAKMCDLWRNHCVEEEALIRSCGVRQGGRTCCAAERVSTSSKCWIRNKLRWFSRVSVVDGREVSALWKGGRDGEATNSGRDRRRGACRNMIGYNNYNNQGYNKLFTQVGRNPHCELPRVRAVIIVIIGGGRGRTGARNAIPTRFVELR